MTNSNEREIMGVSTITYRYQITIPKKVREKFQLKEGDTIVFIRDGDKLTLSKSTEF